MLFLVGCIGFRGGGVDFGSVVWSVGDQDLFRTKWLRGWQGFGMAGSRVGMRHVKLCGLGKIRAFIGNFRRVS